MDDRARRPKKKPPVDEAALAGVLRFPGIDGSMPGSQGQAGDNPWGSSRQGDNRLVHLNDDELALPEQDVRHRSGQVGGADRLRRPGVGGAEQRIVRVTHTAPPRP